LGDFEVPLVDYCFGTVDIRNELNDVELKSFTIMTLIHLLLGRGFSPILLFLLFSGYILLNKHTSCLAVRFFDERDPDDWEPWLSKNPRQDLLVNERLHGNKRKSNYLISIDDERQPLSETVFNDDTDAAIDSLSQWNEHQAVDRPWLKDTATARAARLQANDVEQDVERRKRRNDTLFLAIVGTCSLVGVLGLVAAAIFWYRIQRRAETTLDAEYPSYGVTGPGSNGSKISSSSSANDRKLAQSAQMFHYQQTRQHMMAQEKAQLEAQPVHSDDSDDETPNGGDYTVYECPGLAPTGEMEVRNPLFAEPDPSSPSSTFTSHPATNSHYPQPSATNTSPLSSPTKEKSLS